MSPWTGRTSCAGKFDAGQLAGVRAGPLSTTRTDNADNAMNAVRHNGQNDPFGSSFIQFYLNLSFFPLLRLLLLFPADDDGDDSPARSPLGVSCPPRSSDRLPLPCPLISYFRTQNKPLPKRAALYRRWGRRKKEGKRRKKKSGS